MVFRKKYPDNYHRDIANIELWFRSHSIPHHEVENIIAHYRERLNPKQFVEGRVVETSDIHFTIDYTAMSVTTLKTQKSRYLRNAQGYHVYGFLTALNVQNNIKYAMMVKGSQIQERDLEQFIKAIENDLGFHIIAVTDNRHKHSMITSKKVTMWIEIEHAGLKEHNKVYDVIRPKQHIHKGKIITNMTLPQLILLYYDRLVKCNFKLLNKQTLTKHL